MNTRLKYPTAGIILAAGMSRRFGKPKQLAEIDNMPLIHWVLKNSLNSKLDAITLVLGSAEEKILKTCKAFQNHPKLQIIRNKNYREGMSTSLRAGLLNLKEEFPSAMFLLADQPYVNELIINTLLDRFRNSDKDICVPLYKGRQANPVVFSKKFYAQIMTIKGDIGAREIIRNNTNDTRYVEFEKYNYFIDIDNKVDLEQCKKIKQNEQLYAE